MASHLESLRALLMRGKADAFLSSLTGEELTALLPDLKAEKLELLCWPWLKDLPQLPADEPLWQQLRQAYILEQAYLRFRLDEIAQLEAILGEIQFLVLKGPALLYRLGRNHAYKRSDDLDILVRKADTQAVIEKLQSIGYRRLDAKTNGEFSMMRDKNTTLDVHYHLTASSPFIYLASLELEQIFRTHERVSWNGGTLPIMAVSFGLIHLVIHFAVNHQFNELILLYEIGEYLRRYQMQIDWRKLAAYLRVNALAESFFVCLALLAHLGAPGIVVQREDIVPSRARALEIEGWMRDNQLLAHLIAGTRNEVATNDFPKFCANTPRKRFLYMQGNIAWSKGDYV